MPYSALVTFFDSSLREFCATYKPNAAHRVSPGGAPQMPNSSGYISPRISKSMRCLRRVGTAPGITVCYKESHPRYYIDFIVFYIGWLKVVLPRISGVGSGLDVQTVVYLTGHRKRFPGKGRPPTPYNVNTGVTFFTPGERRRDVVVYRDEEVFKVLMHELIHAYGIDSVHMSEGVEAPIREYFGKRGKIYLNESFTDTVACLFNLAAFAVLWCRVQPGRDPSKVFEVLLAKERDYIIDKSRQVLLHEGYMFDGNGLTARGRATEATHVISYYVIKAINMYHIRRFYEFLVAGGMVLRDDSAYASLVMSFINDGGYWSHISIGRGTPSNTLRMTVVDVQRLILMSKDKLLKVLCG